MGLLPRRGILAIAAVVDVAVLSDDRPVSAKVLADRHGLPPRHLEPVLQALVHTGILRGIRGPRGGYALARDEQAISAADIVKAAGSVETEEDKGLMTAQSALLTQVVLPALAEAEESFASALRGITVAELRRRASRS
jgi:Rrf2 family protein